MVKHTQTNRRLLPTICLSVFDHFVGLALKGLNIRIDHNYLSLKDFCKRVLERVFELEMKSFSLFYGFRSTVISKFSMSEMLREARFNCCCFLGRFPHLCFIQVVIGVLGTLEIL